MRKNDDLISRQDALSFLRNWERVKDYSWGERNIIKATINEIESLPSAQSERTCVNCGRTANNGGWYSVYGLMR